MRARLDMSVKKPVACVAALILLFNIVFCVNFHTVNAGVYPVLSKLDLSGDDVPLKYTGTVLYYNLEGLTLFGLDQEGRTYDISGRTAVWSVLSGPAAVTSGNILSISGSGTVEVAASIGPVTSNSLSLTVANASGIPNTGLPDEIMLSWAGDPETTQTIAWRTGEDTAQDKVQYIREEDFDGSFAGSTTVYAMRSDLYTGCSHFEITLKGLTPGTRYIYRVGREGAWSGPANFVTASSTDRFSFIYMGDVQEGYDSWGGMLQDAYEENPQISFGMLGGDLVDSGANKNMWQQFFANAAPVFGGIPLMPAPGNHDDMPLFWSSFALPQNGPDGYIEKFYSFDYGNCHIAVLDSNYLGIVDKYGEDYGKISTWLKNDLKGSSKTWKFLVFHHPPYPVVSDAYSKNLQETWVPVFEECGVDVVFVGHQHIYMRTKPMHGGQATDDPQDGTVYIMGNAGTKHYAPGPHMDYIAAEIPYVSNYEIIEIDGNNFTLTSKAADGTVIDSCKIRKKALYSITPAEDEETYQGGETEEGIAAMAVKEGASGMKYFRVSITPDKPHSGMETVIFVHMRNGVQIGLNAVKADFDLGNSAVSGFNVQAGDMVKAYIADDLTNEVDTNPVLLQ